MYRPASDKFPSAHYRAELHYHFNILQKAQTDWQTARWETLLLDTSWHGSACTHYKRHVEGTDGRQMRRIIQSMKPQTVLVGAPVAWMTAAYAQIF